MVAFIPVFFFASMYAQIALGNSVSEAGLYLMTFFAGFAVASQFGGRMLDNAGAKAPVVLGCVVAAVGFALWGNALTDLDFNDQWYFIVIAGAGIGLMLGPANTDAINRAPRVNYGEVSGVTQTVRNYGASLGMAVLGTILISRNVANVESSLSDARPAGRAGRRDRAQPHRRRWLTALGAHPGRGIEGAAGVRSDPG